MTQWIGQNTRITGEKEASRLHLLFKKEHDIIEEVNDQCPLDKSDPVLIEFTLGNNMIEYRKENYSSERYNYRRGACAVTRWEGECNDRVCERCGMGTCTEGVKCGVMEWVKRNTLRWFGYMESIKNGHYVKKYMLVR